MSGDAVSRTAQRLGLGNAAPRPSEFDWVAIRRYHDSGHSRSQCQRRFGFSNGAWDRAISRGDIVSRPKGRQGSTGPTRQAVKRLLEAGCSQAAICRELDLSRSTVAYHARSLGIPPDPRFAKRFDWDEIQRAYDSGLSVRGCARKFGFSISSWHQAGKSGKVVARLREMPLDQLLVAGRKRGRGHLKHRLIKAGLKENRCERCGITDWMGEPLNMALHHINGDGLDNRLGNLCLLCPNCHAQTDNYGGRNGHRKPKHASSAS